jgi:hypothetical protein
MTTKKARATADFSTPLLTGAWVRFKERRSEEYSSSSLFFSL